MYRRHSTWHAMLCTLRGSGPSRRPTSKQIVSQYTQLVLARIPPTPRLRKDLISLELPTALRKLCRHEIHVSGSWGWTQAR
jgi:hypothetical protein